MNERDVATAACNSSFEHSGGRGKHDAERYGPCSDHERITHEVLSALGNFLHPLDGKDPIVSHPGQCCDGYCIEDWGVHGEKTWADAMDAADPDATPPERWSNERVRALREALGLVAPIGQRDGEASA